MSITNRIENILIATIAAVIAIAITVAIIEVTSIRTLKKEIIRLDERNDKQNAIIVELAKIEKYKIENKFEQIKAKDGQVVLSVDNKIEAIKLDTIPAPENYEKKKGLFRKLKFW